MKSFGKILRNLSVALIALSGLLFAAGMTVRASVGAGEAAKVLGAAQREITDSDITLSRTSYVYNGTARRPAVIVSIQLGEKTVKLKKDVGYTIQYRNNTDAGTASVTVTGIGNYTGTVTKTFTISPRKLTQEMVSLTSTSYVFNGAARKPGAIVSVPRGDGTVKVKKDGNYTVSYRNNIKAGQAKVTVTGIGNYTGTVTKTFTIEPKPLTSAMVTLSCTSYVYSGTARKPGVIVSVPLRGNPVRLKKDAGYTIEYQDNTDAGKATVTVTGIGNYAGTVTKHFGIVPEGTDLVKVTAGARKLTVRWNVQTAQTAGYQIQTSASSAFSSGNTLVKVPGKETAETTLTELEAGKTYYVRVRTYALKDGKYFYSGWSEAMSASVPTIPPTEKYVALTFDDGPDMRYTSSTGRILDTLERYGARATFFVLASQIDSSIVGSGFAERNKQLVRRAYDLGMEIGSHTYNHKNLNSLSEWEIAREVSSAIEKTEAVIDGKIRLVRPPYGNANQKVRDTVNYPLINWSIDTLDWDSKNPDKIYSKVMSNIRPGSIILMHDIYGTTADAVERVVPALINSGYHIVTVSELYELYGMELQPHKMYYAPWYD